MAGKIITCIVIIGIMAFAVFIIVDSRNKEKEEKGDVQKKKGKSLRKKAAEKILPRETVPADAPEIYIRTKANEPYKKYTMKKKRIMIGSSPDCDIIIDNEIVEGKHIIIEKMVRGNMVYYVLQNLGKVNPVHYRDKEEKRHVVLNYKETVVLEEKDVFHIGGKDIKIGTVTPKIEYVDSPTDRESNFNTGTSAQEEEEGRTAPFPEDFREKYRNMSHSNSERIYSEEEMAGL